MSTPLPSVTVAVATYRRADLLAQTLTGLTEQDYPAELYELLVVDNNSPDRTKDVVDSFATTRNPPRYLCETCQGSNHARNRAIQEAKGEIIVFADDDILVEADWLQQLMAPFVRDASGLIGAVAGEVIPVFPDGCPEWISHLHGPQAFRPDMGSIPPPRIPMGANLAIRRRLFHEIGEFDSRVSREGGRIFSADENSLIRRLRKAGYDVWFAPKAAVRHQMPAPRTKLSYVLKHGFDSARSRVIALVNINREENRSSTAYLLSRIPANILKVIGFAIVALFSLLIFRTGAAQTALLRAWRGCGYLYQIPRSLFRRV